jgi:hypothetical protein
MELGPVPASDPNRSHENPRLLSSKNRQPEKEIHEQTRTIEAMRQRLGTRDRKAEANNWDADTHQAHRDQVHGQDALARLRDAVKDKGRLDGKARKDVMDRLDKAFPHLSALRDDAQSLIDRAGIGGPRADDRALLANLERRANDPATFKAQADIQRFHDRYRRPERKKLFNARGRARETMEGRAADLFATAAQRQEQDLLIDRWQKAADAGNPNAHQIVQRARTKATELEAALPAQAARIAAQARELAGLP